MNSTGIHTRGLTSFFTLFGFIIMAVTGLVLYVVPAGRVAYWTNWEMAALTKDQWGNIHILSSILFIVAGAFHTYFNWKPLMNYFKDKAKRGVKLRRELWITVVVSVWIVVSSIWPFPPLSYLLDFNEYVRAAWVVEDDYEPPFGHAELLSLKTFATKMDIPLSAAVQELRSREIAFESTDETLEEIAANNDMAPMELYMLIKPFEPQPDTSKLGSYTPEQVEVEFAGTGIGNRTIAALAEKVGVEPATAVSRLKAAGIDVSGGQTLKDAAADADTNPIELLKVILIEGYSPARE